MADDSKFQFHAPEPKTIAQFNSESREWEILIDDQWVSLSHLIDSLVEMHIILQEQYKDKLQRP